MSKLSAGRLRMAYGTNGFADHRLDDSLALLADLGYDGVALTLDVRHLDPFALDLPQEVSRLRGLLGDLGLAVVVETGARFLLDPRAKHRPTLLSTDGRDRRLDLVHRAIDVGKSLGAEAVSFWSGSPEPGVSEEVCWERLVDACARLLEHAESAGVGLGFEPEPGMLVDRLDSFDRLTRALGDDRLGLTLDLGHCHCLENVSVADCVRRAGAQLVNVHIEDMRRGVHEHLPFGEGEIEFAPVLAALKEVGYNGLVSVELPRHSHAAPELAALSLQFLKSAEREAVVV